MQSYKVVGKGLARHFEITGGLQEGYGSSGKLHHLDDVVAAHHDWQRATGKILGLTIEPNQVSYGWPQDGAIQCATERGFALRGGISVLYAADTNDDDVWKLLESLAAFIADTLGQTRIYLSYAQEDRILQAEDQSTPSGE